MAQIKVYEGQVFKFGTKEPKKKSDTDAPVPTKQTAYDAAVKFRDYKTAKTMNDIDFGKSRRDRLKRIGRP